MTYYLGVDIGTTSTKTIAFSSNGEVLETVSIAYAMHEVQSGWKEQNPTEIVAAVFSGIEQVYTKLLPCQPALISFSAAMHSLIAVNKHGSLLTQCIIWADNRAEIIAEALKQTTEGKLFYELTGVPIHSMSPLCKLLWIKQNTPDIFEKAYKFIGIKEYVLLQLCNRYLVDTAIASATGLLNIHKLEWEETILNHIGITAEQLSEVVSVKQLIYVSQSAGLSIPANTPVVVGGSDGALSNLGTGATGDELTITIGTSSAARKIVQRVVLDQQMRTFCYHAKDNDYIIGGASNNGAVVLQWLRDSLLQTDETFDELFALLNTVAAGSEGLVFLPYLLGERAPIWNSAARGVYFGLTTAHTKAHLLRASVEGIMYCLYSIGNILTEQEPVTTIYAAGGFARNSVGLQVLADVFGTTVLVTDTVESSALGAVILGAEALGFPFKNKREIIATYQPHAASHQVYKTNFSKFKRLYEKLQEEM